MTGAILGFNLACWSIGCFSSPGAQKSLDNLAATGASWLAVVQTTMMDSAHGRFTTITIDDDADFRAEIRRAKSRGLKVAVKPHVDVVDGTFRGYIDPADKEKWWRDYDAYILDYARLAADEKADLFVVGTELAMMATPAQAKRWKDLIARVRGVYHGPVTYAANWYDYPMVPFWSDVDYIGVDAYFPIPLAEHRFALKTGWEVWKTPLSAQAMASGKPVLFTEFGCSSQKGANMKPWEWNRLGPVDMQVQKDYYETFLEAFSREKWFAGVLVWGWDVDPSSGGPDSYGLTVQGKPAQQVLERFFKAHGGRVPLSPLGLSANQRDELGARASLATERIHTMFEHSMYTPQ